MPGGRSSGRRRLPLVLVALLVAVFGVSYLFGQLGDQGGTAAVGGTTPSVAAQTKAAQAKPRETKPRPTKVPQTSTAPSTSSPAASATTGAPDADAGKRLEAFVRSYYSEVTSDTARTWPQLTPTMQGAARGRAGYDSFWETIDKVDVNQTQADASARRAVVSLTFRKKDGGTSTERHQLTFATDDRGDYRIDSDHLLR